MLVLRVGQKKDAEKTSTVGKPGRALEVMSSEWGAI